MSPFYILFGFAFTSLAALAAGALLLQALRLRMSWPVVFVIGACPLSLTVTLLALAGLAHKGIFLALGLALLGAMSARRADQALLPLERFPRWFWLGFIPFTVAYFFNSMAPEISADGATYHLGVVNRYYAAHRMIRLDYNFYASLSQGVEMLFLFAWSFGRHSAASMVHFAFLLAVPLMLADFGARQGRAFAGAFAALLFYATPVAGMAGTNAYIDVAVAAAWFALFVTLDAAGARAAIPAGMLAGFLYSAKYTAFLALAYVLWALRRNWRALAAASATAGVFVLPWVVRNWVWWRNPFAPMWNAWFPNPLITPIFERDWTRGLRDYGLESIGDWAWNVFVNGDKLSGAIGPAWLIAPLGVLEWPWLLAAAAYPLNIGTRFLLPALPFLAWGAGKFLSRWRRAALALLAAHLVLSWPYFLSAYAEGWVMDRIYWKQALRIVPEEGWLNFRSQEYRVARMIETHVPPGELVYVASQVAESYTLRPIAASYQSTFSLRIRDVMLTPIYNSFWPAWRHEIELPKPMQTIRLMQTARSENARWSISEITPRPETVRVSSDPWLAEYAMDGNPYTRWHCGEPLRPGQWIEIDYGKPVERLTLRLTRDQFEMRWNVEGTDAKHTEWDEGAPVGNDRRWATETMWQLGVRYLSITSDDFGYQEIVSDPASWNLTLIAERGPAKLYKLN